MRLIKLISWVLLCGIVSLAAQATAAPAKREPGRIVAATVRGSVIATNLATQTPVDLKDGTIITQNYVVTTGARSSVILLLSNGAALNLGPESTLSIDEFLQDPFADAITLADLKEEPTTSVTKLHLSRGELVGNVKKIKTAEGSSFTVNTPVGAAGIRGTTFRIVFRPTASGRVFFTLSTAEGDVLYEAPMSRATVSVPTGQEVVVAVEVRVNPTTGTVAIVSPPVVGSTQPIPPSTQAAIAVASQQIVQAAAGIIISLTNQAEANQAAAENAAAEKAAREKADEEKADEEKTDQEKIPSEQEKGDQGKTPSDEGKSQQERSADPSQGQQRRQDQLQDQLPPPTTPSSHTTPGDGQ